MVPQDCRGVSKLRHVKIYWRTEPSPSFVAEVVGRCNGACIRGTQYKESSTVTLPEDEVSTIGIGQSCFIFFAPAVRTFTGLRLQPSYDGEEQESDKRSGASNVKRFPKIWSKAIIDVFGSVGVNELTQSTLVEQFKAIHDAAVTTFFGEANPNIDDELWSYLKRFISKAPFEFDVETGIIKFDPASVKPKAPPASKKQKVGSDIEDSSIMGQQGAIETDPDSMIVE